jgi:hypothetical protein
MHKRICKKVSIVWTEYDLAFSDCCDTTEATKSTNDEDFPSSSSAITEQLRASSHLASEIIDYSYFSTDTVERGASIYENALRKLLFCVDRKFQPFYNVQALLIVAVSLGYDDAVFKMIAFLNCLKVHGITDYDSPQFSEFYSQIAIDTLSLKSPRDYIGENPDLVFSCLLLIRMRQLAQYRIYNKNEDSSNPSKSTRSFEDEVRLIVEVCKERRDWLFDCIPPDGDPLDPDAASELFGKLSYWLIIKDCFALTPGVMGVYLEFVEVIEPD